VLADREDRWSDLREARVTVARAARRQMTRERRLAADSIAELLDES
jgi:hypothetical protein